MATRIQSPKRTEPSPCCLRGWCQSKLGLVCFLEHQVGAVDWNKASRYLGILEVPAAPKTIEC